MKVSLARQADDDRKLSIVISIMVIGIFLINFFPDFGLVKENIANIISTICKGVILLCLIANSIVIFRNLSNKVIMYIFLVCCIFLMNYIYLNNNPNFLNTATTFFTTVLPLVLVIGSIRDHGILQGQLLNASRIVLAISIVGYIFKQGIILNYSMALSNSLTLPAVCCMTDYYMNHRKTSFVLSLLGIVIMILVGSRGSLIGVAIFAMVLLLRGVISNRNRTRSIIILFVLLAGMVFFDQILTLAYGFLQGRGMNSRTLWMFTNNLLGYGSNREIIYSGMLSQIKAHPLAIHGIAGEYQFAGNAYAHNIFLELIIDFGGIIGGVAILFVILLSMNTLYGFFKDDSIPNICRLELWAVSFPISLISGTIWSSVYLWMWLFISIDFKKNISPKLDSHTNKSGDN